MLEAASPVESHESSRHNQPPKVSEKMTEFVGKLATPSTAADTTASLPITTSLPTTTSLPIMATTSGRGDSFSLAFATTSAG
jgi:hypothetical protein